MINTLLDTKFSILFSTEKKAIENEIKKLEKMKQTQDVKKEVMLLRKLAQAAK